VWLQLIVMCGCNLAVSVVKTTWLFMIASMNSVFATWLSDYKIWFFCDCKKPEQCVFATIFCVWLQLDVMSGCNLTVFVRLKLLDYVWLQPDCVITRDGSLWLQKKPEQCVCNYLQFSVSKI
jgi:hypothetical protein